MEIPKNFDFAQQEDKWYKHWMDKGYFKSTPDHREPYTIVIPPPNVTGVLHMGHMLNNTIQDVLIRKARLQGKNACWVPGTDHASIATEAKVVALLKEKGIEKKDLTREEFLKYAWEWKEKYGGIILDQLKKLGASCDWDRTKFTMDEDLSAAVIEVFVDLYNKGLIYRGVRMVNWDPLGKTALSDEEVIHKEVQSKLYYVQYPIFNDGEAVTEEAIKSKLSAGQTLTIATTRPETICADTGVCVHPEDARYTSLVGKKCLIPFTGRLVPIIADDYIDIEFGTGCLKVTPAHDINDYNLGIKHKLPIIDCLNPDGTLTEAGGAYKGMDRFAVRKQIAIDLEQQGYLTKTQELQNKVGTSERTGAVIEPRLSMQWFMKMEDISKPALDNVLNGEIKLIPDKFINTYRHWMENVKDWCISRQLWWGQQIPAYYLADGTFVVAETKEEAIAKAREVSGNANLTAADLKQDDDVLDTWFSSWLWPISVFDGFKDPNNADINYYYPTNDLVTAPEILFFWVARMIIAGYEYRGKKPFTNVYLTGIVRDKQGRKMSKSLGNSPDPVELMAKYSTDGVRLGMLLSSPAGNDLPFDESLCEQGRNFTNKVWNAFRLVKSWSVEDKPSSVAELEMINWFENRLNQSMIEIEDHFSKYRISDALMSIYKLVWDDFCAWFLEGVKPGFGEPASKATYDKVISLFETQLALLHPFIPFITEEIWHLIKDRKADECLIISQWPTINTVNTQVLQEFETASNIIANLRGIRQEKGLSPKEALALMIRAKAEPAAVKTFKNSLLKLGNISSIELVEDKPSSSLGFLAQALECYIPFTANINVDEEKQKLSKEIDYLKGFLKSVNAKLSNERFMANAKADVVENERKKMADAESKIKALEEQLVDLGVAL